jgi:hypothetical protein
MVCHDTMILTKIVSFFDLGRTESCWYRPLSESILTSCLLLKIMRGRWASAAIGAGVARRRAGAEMDQQAQAFNAQQDQAQRQIEAQQKQIEALQQQKQQAPAQPQQEDPAQKLKKYADLKQQGIITEEEYQKLKADLLSKM